MTTDFSFQNTKIMAFFNGDNSNPPTDELIYLHTHPLIRPNFLVQIDMLTMQAGDKIKNMNLVGFPTQEMARIAIEIGSTMPIIDKTNALSILMEMRKLYSLCTGLLNS